MYGGLRRLAAEKLARENPGQTLQATALVHEAYLRLVGSADAQRWDSRRHFFAAAAEAMRRILVERARRKKRQKRGGGRLRIDLEQLTLSCDGPSEEVLALDEALTELARKDPAKAEVVKLRYFAGLTLDQGLAPQRQPGHDLQPPHGSPVGLNGVVRFLDGGAP